MMSSSIFAQINSDSRASSNTYIGISFNSHFTLVCIIANCDVQTGSQSWYSDLIMRCFNFTRFCAVRFNLEDRRRITIQRYRLVEMEFLCQMRSNRLKSQTTSLKSDIPLTISLGSASLLLQKIFAKFGDGLSGRRRTISISTPFYAMQKKTIILIQCHWNVYE